MRATSPMAVLLLFVPAVAGAQSLPDPYPYPEPAWSPYLAGAGVGLLLLATLAIAKHKIGASSAYLSAVGLVGRLVAPRHFASIRHYRDHPPTLDWTLVFVIAAIGGAFLAAWSGGELTGTYLQDLWVARFGADSGLLRGATALAGGVLIALGSRIAGGCTSGHGISGTAQLSPGSWVAVIAFFVGGIAVAVPLYRS